MDAKQPINIPRRWSQLSYAGESHVPVPVDSTVGTWPTYYLRRDAEHHFLAPDGEVIALAIRNPDTIDFENEQLKIVQETMAHISPEQIAIAEYWGSGPPTKQWTPVIDRLIDTYGLSPGHALRVLASVQAAINDVNVVVFWLKFLWDRPRPDQLDQDLATVLCTPRFPTYPSGHAAVSGVAETVLSYYFAPEVPRLHELAEQCALSRLYAGVHFPADNEQGLRLGRQIGGIIVETLKAQYDGDEVKLDVPYTVDLHAKCPPPPYRQAIPFVRPRVCSSKILPIPAQSEQ